MAEVVTNIVAIFTCHLGVLKYVCLRLEHSLRKHIQAFKNSWFQQRAMEAEKYSQEKNHREFYVTLNAAYGPRSRNYHPVRSKNGELLTGSEAIKNRRVKHFSDLLNQPSDVDLSIVDEIDQLPVNDLLNRPIEQQELEQALKDTKIGKSPGADGVFPELLVHGGRCLWTFLLTLFNIVWASELIPTYWIDAIITILFKKGDRSDCGNYRGISLLSAVGKVFADVVLQRLHWLAECIYPQSQSGYRNGRGTIDGVFTLRQLMEKPRKQRKNLYIAFVVFVKAFDRVNGEQGWRSGESARLPPMWPGFDSRTRRHMWVEFVVGSLPCSKGFFSGFSGFPPSAKTNTPNSNSIRNLWTNSHSVDVPLQILIYLFIYLTVIWCPSKFIRIIRKLYTEYIN